MAAFNKKHGFNLVETEMDFVCDEFHAYAIVDLESSNNRWGEFVTLTVKWQNLLPQTLRNPIFVEFMSTNEFISYFSVLRQHEDELKRSIDTITNLYLVV